jgi:hypothetical protein
MITPGMSREHYRCPGGAEREKEKFMSNFRNAMVLVCMLFLLNGCSREPEFAAPDLVDKNPVRPETIIVPQTPETNSTNQAR